MGLKILQNSHVNVFFNLRRKLVVKILMEGNLRLIGEAGHAGRGWQSVQEQITDGSC